VGSPFDVLRVDPDADDDEIRRAYRRRVKKAHPDQDGSAEEFQRVKAAYEAIVSGAVERFDDRDSDAEPAVPTESDRTEVEYLNYGVFDDYGWSLDDDDLFERAADADLDAVDYGRFRVDPDETLLEAAENRGFAWPYACRGGACANCAVVVTEGDLSTPVDHILPGSMVERSVRLSCVGEPLTDELSVVFNVKHMPDLEELRLPPRPFERAQDD
jgi:curved DNA-binding protein CbpA